MIWCKHVYNCVMVTFGTQYLITISLAWVYLQFYYFSLTRQFVGFHIENWPNGYIFEITMLAIDKDTVFISLIHKHVYSLNKGQA